MNGAKTSSGRKFASRSIPFGDFLCDRRSYGTTSPRTFSFECAQEITALVGFALSVWLSFFIRFSCLRRAGFPRKFWSNVKWVLKSMTCPHSTEKAQVDHERGRGLVGGTRTVDQYQKILEKEKEIVLDGCSRWQTQPGKICKSQHTKFIQGHSLLTFNCFYALHFCWFSQVVLVTSDNFTQNLLLYFQCFLLNWIPFFSLFLFCNCSVLRAANPRWGKECNQSIK